MALLLTLLDLIYMVAFILLLARVFMPLMGISPYHPAYEFVFRITEPVLEPIRRRLPQSGMLDFSPMVFLLGLWLLRIILVSFLR
jgi:YggT family protein